MKPAPPVTSVRMSPILLEFVEFATHNDETSDRRSIRPGRERSKAMTDGRRTATTVALVHRMVRTRPRLRFRLGRGVRVV